MTRHSKNSSTSGSFTHAERQKLSYGSQSARCTRDSLRPFIHCHLCLEMARDPNSCPMGHVACRSCYLEDILAQKNSFKVKKSEYDRKINEMNEKKRAEEDIKRADNLKAFLTQQGTKRSFDQIDRTDESTSTTISSALITASAISVPTPPKEEICCRAGLKGPHPLSMKSLLLVKFSEPEKDKPGCPSCLKLFNSSNALKGCLFKGCGHVVCEPCYKTLSDGQKKCLVCEDVRQEVIVLESEGTGFAAGGGIVETKRYDIAFQ